MALILVVEDERELASLLCRQLEAEGHQTLAAYDGKSALDLAQRTLPDLLVLDWMLPGLDGLTVIRRLRERSAVPILMLTARAEEADRVLGLEVGADDYLTKPFSLRELLARVRAILRRVDLLRQASAPREVGETPIEIDALHLDPLARRVTLGNELLDLTPKEYDLLLLMARHPGRTFSRNYLLDQIWGADYEGGDRTVDTHVVRLRKKLGAFGERIVTAWGVGYRLEA